MIVVSNSSPLINLAYINQLEILHTLYNEIRIPESVYNEIVVAGRNKPGAVEIKNREWITVQKVQNPNFIRFLETELDRGESEAIALSIELSAGLILIDERKGRRIAEQFGLKCIGILGIIIEAKKNDLIDDAKTLIDTLVIEAGYRISNELLNHVFDYLDELEKK